MPSEPATPELDKMRAVRDDAELLTRFVDWLEAEHIRLARYGELYDVRLPCPACCTGTEGHVRRRPRAIVAGCSGLDASKLTVREKQVLATPEGITAYKANLLTKYPCPRCRGECFIYEQRVRDDVLVEHHEPYEDLFARFFKIDRNAVEEERRALLERVRERNSHG